MKKIEFYCVINLDGAYKELQKNAPCYGEFNGKNIFSTDSIDDIYIKCTGKTKAEFDEDRRKKVEEYKKINSEFKVEIPQLIKKYRERARGVIPEEHLKFWDEIVPVRLNDIYKGFELDCLLVLIEVLNDTSKEKSERFEICKQLFDKQNHSGMSARLVFKGLDRFHELGNEFVSYIDKGERHSFIMKDILK